MKLQSITATNMKGRNFEVSLDSPVTAIVGNNRKGKTSVLDAVEIALLGYNHRRGKRPGDTLSYASGRELVVVLKMSEGNYIARRFWREGKSAKTNERSELPEGWNMPVFTMDFNEFLRMSGPDRTSYVMSRLDLPAIGYKDSTLREALFAGKSLTELQRKVVTELQGKFDELVDARQQEGIPVNQFLETLESTFADLAKDAQKVLDETGAVLRGMTDVAGNIAPTRAIDLIRQDLDQGHARSGELREQLSKLEQSNQATEVAQKRLASLQGELDKLKAGYPFNVDDKIAAVEKRIKAVEGRIATLKMPASKPANTSALEKLKSDLEGKLLVSRDQLSTFGGEARSVLAARQEAENLLAENKGKPCCPICGRKGTAFKEALEELVAQKIAECDSKGKEIDDFCVKLRKQITELEAERAKVAGQIRLLQTTASEEVTRLTQEVVAEGRSLNAELTTARTDLNTLKTVKRDMERIASEMAQVKDRAAFAKEPIDELQQEFNTLQSNLRAYADEYSRASIKADRELQFATARAKADEQSVLVQLCKEAAGVVKATIADYTAKGINTLIEPCNLLWQVFVPEPITFANGEFGYWLGPTWVCVDTFSGLEKAVAFSGLGVALCQNASVKVPMIDEVIIDDDNKRKLGVALVDLVKRGVIDGALIVDTVAYPWDNIAGVRVERAG